MDRLFVDISILDKFNNYGPVKFIFYCFGFASFNTIILWKLKKEVPQV
ncbi:MAG: hypothetical protein JW866_04330 [Ignavibacteriales bacterium]|nr:hypothetical protein [Ignavibacteriales bacterium]